MSKSKVAVLKTNPESVIEDYAKLMKLADFEDHLPKDKDTILKINISWHYYFPACSTTPWQEGQRCRGTSPVPRVTPAWQDSQATPRAT